MSNFKVTLEEIQMYHKMGRKMLTRLIMDMMRDPAESLLIIATWLWLEERGFSNIIGKTVGVSDILVSMLADEAVIFLKSLNVHTPRIDLKGGIHFTTHVTDRKLSLQTFEYSKRFTAIVGIRNTLQTVCSRIFTDILLCMFFGTPAKKHGDCVERIEMGNVSTVYEQPLYARLILKSLTMPR